MDPITIWMSRYRDRPVQVFTGFLDKTPYAQLYPGTVTLKATCTLKRLLHKYWDPALPFAREFMEKQGWMLDPDTGQMRNLAEEIQQVGENGTLTDGSMGRTLYEVLTEPRLGNFQDNEVFIEALPAGIVQQVQKIFKAFSDDENQIKDQLEHLYTNLIGTSSSGSGGTGGGAGSSVGRIPEQRKGRGKGALIGTRESTAYGPPWVTSNGDPGTGVTSDGTDYRAKDANGDYPKAYSVAVLPGDSELHKGTGTGGLGMDVYIWPNPFNWDGLFTVNDHIGHGSGLDFYDWRGPSNQLRWGRNQVKVWHEKESVPTDADADLPGGLPGSTSNVTAHSSKTDATSDSQDNDSSTSTSTSSSDDRKLYKLCKDWTAGGGWGGPGGHHGLDMLTDGPKLFYAPCRCKVIDVHDEWWGKGRPSDETLWHRGDGVVRLETLDDHGAMKKGTILGYGHAENYRVKQGDVIDGGTPVCDSGFANAWHIHFFVGPPGSDARDGQVDQASYVDAFEKGDSSTIADPGIVAGGSSTSSTTDTLDQSTAAAFAVALEWPSLEQTAEAMMLTGQKSLMNDVPLMPFIQQICGASLRQFQSLPNGDFFAFFPDYFGNYNHRKPYWNIDDIEILDGQIELTDDALATHVYTVGDTGVPYDGITMLDKVMSHGVVTIFNAFQSEFVLSDAPDNPEEKLMGKKDALKFLEKYGARPYFEEAALVRSPYFEAFLAFQTFQLMWSRTFLTEFEFTFMPEIFPGGIVSFSDYSLQCYVDSVTHTFDYEAGFTTTAQLSAPANTGEGFDPLGISRGLIRSAVIDG